MSYIYVDFVQCRRIAAKIGAAAGKIEQAHELYPWFSSLPELCAKVRGIERDILAAADEGEHDEESHFDHVKPSEETLRRAVEGTP